MTTTNTTAVTTIQTANGAITAPVDIKAQQKAVMEAVEKNRKPTAKAAPKGKTKDAGAAAFGKIAGTVKSTMVTMGGTKEEPTKVDAAEFARVTFAELTNTGSVLQNLAYNFLAGTVDDSVTVESLAKLPRALRNEKGAIVKLLGKKAADIRAKWEALQAERKRKDQPSLRVLASMFSEKKAGASQTWQEKVGDILNSARSDKMKLQMLAELITPAK